jgi:hypothetical protein
MSALEQARSTLHLAVNHPLRFLYLLLQLILDLIFSPSSPPPGAKGGKIQRQRIAVIGAGLTGVSSAAHYVDHGFDVKILEARSKEHGLSGIWSVCLTADSHYTYLGLLLTWVLIVAR